MSHTLGPPHYSKGLLTFALLLLVLTHTHAKDDLSTHFEDYNFENNPRLQKHIEGLEAKYSPDKSKVNIRKAIQIFEELSTGNDSIAAQALYELGDTYLYGTSGFMGIWRDSKKALDFFNKSAKFGYGPALHMASYALASGFDDVLQPNESGAMKLEYVASLTNHLPAILGMGFRFLVGHGVEKKCELSLKYYKYAAEALLTSEFFYPSAPLGDFERFSDRTFEAYDQAERYNAQKDEAMEYWEAQAKGGDPMAQYELAKMKSEDPQNSKKVAELYEQAADQGFVQALRELGLAHIQGDGVQTNFTKGIDYLEKAADMGDPESQNFLGYLNLFGNSTTFPINQNVTKALQYFEEASLQDFPESLFFMGEITIGNYENSTHTPTKDDYRLATRFYERSADSGYTLAFFKLGHLYDSGEGYPRSCEAAAHAYKIIAETGPWNKQLKESISQYLKGNYKAALLANTLYAEEGYEVAQMNAAWLYINCKACGGKKSHQKALRLFYLTYLQGNPKSCYEMADIYLHGRGGITKNIPMATELLKFGLKRGDLRVLPLLSYVCEHGLGNVKKDLNKAEIFLLYFLDYHTGALPFPTHTHSMETEPTLTHTLSNLSHTAFLRARIARIQIKKNL